METATCPPLGFGRRSGYRRLHVDAAPPGEALPRLPSSDYAHVLDVAYRGLWGHKLVAPGARLPASAVVLGLYEADEPLGLCTIFPSERLIDGPGVAPGRRAAGRYVRLLLGACALLGRGPADVDSWGDDPEVIAAYVDLGFSVVEEVGGWELRLD